MITLSYFQFGVVVFMVAFIAFVGSFLTLVFYARKITEIFERMAQFLERKADSLKG